ncbi:MAG: hypothetical protein PHD07_00845, partial [Bacteroidales bacterium]|nr:hypothetical protein [Bacteroidales bacterium]
SQHSDHLQNDIPSQHSARTKRNDNSQSDIHSQHSNRTKRNNNSQGNNLTLSDIHSQRSDNSQRNDNSQHSDRTKRNNNSQGNNLTLSDIHSQHSDRTKRNNNSQSDSNDHTNGNIHSQGNDCTQDDGCNHNEKGSQAMRYKIKICNSSHKLITGIKLRAVTVDKTQHSVNDILPALFSDGYFNLLPGEERIIMLEIPEDQLKPDRKLNIILE